MKVLPMIDWAVGSKLKGCGVVNLCLLLGSLFLANVRGLGLGVMGGEENDS